MDEFMVDEFGMNFPRGLQNENSTYWVEFFLRTLREELTNSGGN